MFVCVSSSDTACQVLELEDKKGEWGFKALKQMMKILFRKVRCALLWCAVCVLSVPLTGRL